MLHCTCNNYNSCRTPIYFNISYLLLQRKKHENDSTKNEHMLDSCDNLGLGKQEIYMNETMKSYPIVSNNHPLRNPIVNMLPKILPATLNPNASNTSKKTSTSNDDNNDKEDNNLQVTKEQTGTNKAYKNIHNSLKANAEEVKSSQTDKLQDKSNSKLNTVLTRSSKVSDNSPQISSGLRKTTPRLAKTRSAQNMKLMAQVLGSKSSSSCSTLKSKEKDNVDKTASDDCTVSKVVSSTLLH